ncbi:MAG: serine/threonine-protein kinase, partial [Nocardioides sp.]
MAAFLNPKRRLAVGQFPVPGEQYGRYTVVRLLGRGGMGQVFEAVDATLGRSVALKVLAPDLSRSEEFHRRFAHEASTLARVDSPHVLEIYEYGEVGGSLFLTTQLVKGGDLQRALATNGAMSVPDVVTIGEQLCEALAAAHEVGIVHRDVKPSNVLLRARPAKLHAYLGDFGIAVDEVSDFTRTGLQVGSTAYMAPERHEGLRDDPRSDLYSLACVLHFAATGRAPYGGTDVQVAMAHISAPIPHLIGSEPRLSALDYVLHSALAKKVEDRPQGAEEFAALLAAVVQSNVGFQAPSPTGSPRATEPTLMRVDGVSNSADDSGSRVGVPMGEGLTRLAPVGAHGPSGSFPEFGGRLGPDMGPPTPTSPGVAPAASSSRGRSNTVTALVAFLGVLTALTLVASLYVVGRGGDDAPSASGTASRGAESEAEVLVASIYGLIQDSSRDKANVQAAAQELTSCGDLVGAANTFAEAENSRNDLARRAQELDPSALPGAAQLINELIQGWQYSARADAAFADAARRRPCVSQSRELETATRMSARSHPHKDTAAILWNGIC